MARTSSKSSSKNVTRALRQVRHKMKLLDDEVTVNSSEISKRVAEELKDEILTNYKDFLTSKVGPDDKEDRSDFGVEIERYGTGYSVNVIGSQVIYDEFGTGQRGEDEPHKEKGKYGLNPYSSGSTIKEDKEGHYWMFKHTKTHGVPAGMFVYNSFTNVADSEALAIAAHESEKRVEKIMKGK